MGRHKSIRPFYVDLPKPPDVRKVLPVMAKATSAKGELLGRGKRLPLARIQSSAVQQEEEKVTGVFNNGTACHVFFTHSYFFKHLRHFGFHIS